MTRVVAALLLFAVAPLAAAVDSYTLDPHYPIHFSADHLGMATVYGHFSRYTGKFTMDRSARTGSLEVTVETGSVDTGDGDKGSRPRSRDETLRSAEFFNAAEFPRMSYRSTNVIYSTDSPSLIEGTLTLLGVTRPLKLTVQRFKCTPATASAPERCGGYAVGKLRRSEFGMSRGIPAVGDEITLLIGFEADKD
ncbi:MAG: YceI family protein [Betaproteobacteria bacterium]